jgi:hypothetical protein
VAILGCTTVQVATDTDPEHKPHPKGAAYFVATEESEMVRGSKLAHDLRTVMARARYRIVDSAGEADLIVRVREVLPGTIQTTGLQTNTATTTAVDLYYLRIAIVDAKSGRTVWTAVVGTTVAKVARSPGGFLGRLIGKYGRFDRERNEVWFLPLIATGTYGQF